MREEETRGRRDAGIRDEKVAVISDVNSNLIVCLTPDDTFALGESLGASLTGGEVVLLYGGLGAGKTLFTKGIMSALDFDIDEVTSPSFTLVNLYKTSRIDVYHIDLWRLDTGGETAAVGLDEILETENAVTIIEWADHLGDKTFDRTAIKVVIDGDGELARQLTISR